MRVIRSGGAALAMLGVIACAKIEPPPGGPPDTSPPQLVGVTPDSLTALPGYKGDVEFRFSEVVSEGSAPSTGSGTGDLERLILLSPTTRVPVVSWKRSRITVHPREGWQPGRVYRVELLPGVMDLRNNRSTTAHAVVTFTTGGAMPADTLRGQVTDWTTGQPLARALVVAILLPDSLPYRFTTDSAGRFSAGPLPGGSYLVYGVVDQNNNFLREDREAFDSVTAKAPGAAIALWTFPHDTTPPRIRTVTAMDSVTARIEFAQPLDPHQRIDTSIVSVRHLPDSGLVRVALLATQAGYDSVQRAERKDTTAGRAGAPPSGVLGALRPPGDTTPGRPALSSQLIVRLAQKMDTAGQYLVEIRNVRNVTGVAATARGVFAAQRPPAVRATPDSAAGDTTRTVPDSTRRDSLPPPASKPRS